MRAPVHEVLAHDGGPAAAARQARAAVDVERPVEVAALPAYFDIAVHIVEATFQALPAAPTTSPKRASIDSAIIVISCSRTPFFRAASRHSATVAYPSF